MQGLPPKKFLPLVLLAGTLVGCADTCQPGLGAEGMSHPNATQGVTNNTDQGAAGTGSTGNRAADDGSNLAPPSPLERVPR
jgi:hypothetical protein